MNFPSFLRRGRRVLLATIGTLACVPTLSAFAAMTSFTDVSAGVWYEQAAANLLASGALDSSQSRLRPDDLATRGEVFKMLVNLNRIALANPTTPSFGDVPRGSSFFQYVETAAREGWLKGDNNCYGQGSATCTASPLSRVNRAEMAALLQRSFNLSISNAAPRASDVSSGAWFATAIQASADHCILQGDDGSGLMRPGSFMNRAEMIVMFDRTSMDQRYGVHCGEQPEAAGAISDAESLSARMIKVVFNIDLDPNFQGQTSHYSVDWTSNGSAVEITDVNVLNGRMVELVLGSDLRDGVEYRISAKNMRSQRGVSFEASKTFTSDEGRQGTIESITASSPTSIALVLSGNIDATSATNTSHYQVSGTSGSTVLLSAKLTNATTVTLTLATPLQNQQSYAVTVDGLIGQNTMTFSDSTVLLYNSSDVSLTATLLGQNETPPVSTFSSGTGVFLLTSAGLQYDITVQRIDDAAIVGAHFNRGAAGVEGPVLKDIVFDGLRSTGTWINLTRQDRDDILNGRIYVEVDGSYYSDGKIRGQLKQ